MKPPILSSEEIAALMDGFGATPGSAPMQHSVAAQSLDQVMNRSAEARQATASPTSASIQDPMLVLDSINQAFAVGFATALSKLTNCDQEVFAQTAKTWSLRDWSSALRQPLLANVVRVQRVASPCWVVFEAAWLASLVDLTFGGTGTVGDVARRKVFSPVERAVAKRVALLICHAYARACAANMAMRMTWQRSQNKGGAIGFARSEETVAATEFTMTCGQSTTSLWILLPMAAVEFVSGSIGSPSKGA